MRNVFVFCAFSAMSLFAHAVYGASVYRCTDSKDMVQSQLTPCAPGEKQEIIGADGKTSEQRLQSARGANNPFDWVPHVGMSREIVVASVNEIVEARYPRNTEKYKRAYNCWSSFSGMTPDINRTTSASGEREQWVFRYPSHDCYLYITNGVVTAIQD